jgi:hypothetical protein
VNNQWTGLVTNGHDRGQQATAMLICSKKEREFKLK